MLGKIPNPTRGDASVTRLANGHIRVDEFAWLEDIENPSVLQHIEAEEAYCADYLGARSPDADEIFKEMCARISLDDQQRPVAWGDHLYYMRSTEAGQHFIHCRRRKNGGAEEVLLDESALPVNGDMQVASLVVSPDQKRLLFTVASADERCTLYVKSLCEDGAASHSSEAPLRNIRLVATNVASNAAWMDETRIAYLELDDSLRPHRLLIGDVAAALVSSSILYQEADKRFHLSVRRAESGRFVYLTARTLLTSQQWALQTSSGDPELKPLTDRREGIDTYITDQGPFFYYLTNEDAPDFKLLRRSIAAASDHAASVVIAHAPGTRLAHIHAFAHHLVILRRYEGTPQFLVLSGEDLFEIPLPESAIALHQEENRDYASDVFRFAYDSFVTPYSVIEYDLVTRRVVARAQMAVPAYDEHAYRVDRIMVPASDDRLVPVTLVRPRRASSHPIPIVLYCYGAYGHSVDPEFSAARLSLLDRGIGFAIAHIRGGGELGHDWHKEGRGQAKPRAILDFIEVGEHLIREGIATPDGLAAFGQSAGGLIVTAAVNQDPCLFKAQVADVPFVDPISTLLDDDHPFTPLDREEWGNPKEPQELETLLSYAPYDTVRFADYPATLLTGGFHDAHVGLWEPAKMASRLRAFNTASTPILFHPRLSAGHEMAAGRDDELWEWSVIFAFLIQQLQPNVETNR